MKQMLSCPKTQGKVIEVQRNPYFFGREFQESPNVYTKGKNTVYRIVASVCNPSTGEEVLVTSELYSRNVNPYIEDGYVNVYYSTTGEYWIDISK